MSVRGLIPWMLGCSLLACASAPPTPSDSVPAVISVRNVACVECARELVQVAQQQPGVRAAHFDDQKVELQLELAPGTDPASVVKALDGREMDGAKLSASLGAGHGSYRAFAPLDPAWDARQLSAHGEDVELAGALAAGKVTVVDFYADWCGPCHDLDEHLHALLAKDPKLAYRRANIVSWDSPIAKHLLADARELPYVIVFDGAGKERTRISGLHLDELDAAIHEAAR